MAITLPFATFSRHEDGEWSETTIGTPQWAVVSPLLANLLPTPRFRSMDRGTRGLRLRGSAARLAMYRRDSVLPSPSRRQGRRPQFVVFEAQYPARRCPCLRFGSHLTMRPARPGVRMDSLLLSCRTVSFPIACRFIPAHLLSHKAPNSPLRELFPPGRCLLLCKADFFLIR